MQKQSIETIKIIMLGNSGTGRTNIMTQYCESKFNQQHMQTIGIDFKSKIVQHPCGMKLKVLLFQFSGGYKFQQLTQTYYKDCYGFIFVYDITDRHSFQLIDMWLQKALQNGHNDAVGILLANKKDLSSKRTVSQQQGIQLSKKIGKYFQISAKTGEGIQQSYLSIISSIICKQKSLKKKKEEYQITSTKSQTATP